MISSRHCIFSLILLSFSPLQVVKELCNPSEQLNKNLGFYVLIWDDPLLSDLEETVLLVLPRKLTSLSPLTYTQGSWKINQ